MIFAVFDPSPLTVCINCSFFTFISVITGLRGTPCTVVDVMEKANFSVTDCNAMRIQVSFISEHELAFTFAIYIRCSVCLSVCLSVVCLSVMFVHPTQPVEIFGHFFRHLEPYFYGDRPIGNPPSGDLGARG